MNAFRLASASLMLMILLVSTGLAAGPTPAVDQAWQLLWSNDLQGAAARFAELSGDGDGAALQGLLLAQLSLGRSVEAADALDRYLDGVPHDAADLDVVTFALRNLGLEGRDRARNLASSLDRLVTQRDLDPIDRRRALDLQQKLAMAAGDGKKATSITRDLNRITDWALLGPFDNTSGSGHRKDYLRSVVYAPLDDYEGKFGQPLRWFRPDLLPLDGSIVPSNHFYQDQYVTSYVRTAVNVPDAGEYLLSVGFRGDLEVQLNDNVLAAADSEVGGSERLHWRVALPAGWNRLACKLSHREDGDGLTMALSNLDGSAIKNLEVAADKNGMAVMREVQAQPVVSARDQALATSAEAAPDDPRAAFWHLELARRSLAPDAIIDLCDQLDQRFADVAVLRLAVANARYQAGARARHEQVLGALAELAPDLAEPQIYLGAEDLAKKRVTRALERAMRVLEVAPTSPGALALKLDVYAQDHRWQDLKNGALKAANDLPDESFPYFALMRWASEVGDRKALAEHRKRAVDRMPPGARSIERLNETWNKEDYGDARGLAEDLAKLAPDLVGVWRLYIRALIAEGNVKQAAEELPHLLENFPLDVGLVQMQANTILAGLGFDRDAFIAKNPALVAAARRNMYLRNDAELARERKKAWRDEGRARQEAAAEVLATAVVADPGNFRLRDQVRSWQGQKPYREFFPDLKSADIMDLRVDPADHGGHGAVILRSVNRTFVFDGQASLLDRTLVVQMLDQSGVEEWEVFDPGLGWRRDLTFVEHAVIKADGGVEQGDRFRGKLMFKGLEPGDVVHIRYQLPTIITGHLAGNVWDQQLFASPRWPTCDAVYELVTPTSTAVQFKTWNDPGDVAQPHPLDLDDGYRGLRWRFRDLPAFAQEPGAADPRYYLPWVDVSTLDDWSVIARWYHDLGSGQAEPDAEIVRQAAELTEGLDDDGAKLAAIFRFVANQITYESIPLYQSAYIPRRASMVLRDGFGDCKDKSCLMIALGRAAGIEGLDFALVTPNAPAEPAFMPSPRFNHAVVCRSRGLGRYEWYDPTLRLAEPGQVPRYLDGVPALVANRFNGDLVIIDSGLARPLPTQARAQVTLDQDGNATVERTVTVVQVDRLAGLRRQLASLTEDDLRKRLVRSLTTDHPGVAAGACVVEGLAAGADTVVMREQFTVPELAQVDGGLLALRVPWRSDLQDWSGVVVADQQRTSPVNLRLLNVCEEESLDLVLPAGSRLTAVPDGKSLVSGGCRYETAFERTDTGVRVTRRLVLDGNVVSLADYQEFKDFLDGVRRDMRRSLHLRTS